MKNVAWALVAAAMLATNTGCTGFYLQEFASWRKSLACGACCPYGYRGCRGIGCGDACGERGYCGGRCACDCGCRGGCMPFGGGCCQDGCWREHCGCVDGPWVQGQCCGPDCGWGCGNGGNGGGCCPCGGAGCDNCCNDVAYDDGCANDYGGDCCPCGGEGCDNCCNDGYEDCGGDCGGCETCSSGFCGCVDDGGCQGACWDGTCRRKKCSWLCRLGGCGEVYWNEWISDPPDCCDPCNCCSDYIDPMFSRHHAPPEHCGGYAGYGHGGHHMHDGHGMQGEVYESHGVGDYTMNRGRSKKSWSVADGFNELFAQQPPRQRRAIHVPAAGMSGPTLAAEPMAPAPRFDGPQQSIARAPRQRTQAAVPQGRVAKQAPRTAQQQPTPALEEHEVEGSFKVVEDRAVDEPSNVAATPEGAAAPKVARQPERKTAPRAARRPTRPTTSRDAARLDRSI